MFLRNTWYIAAWNRELGDKPMAVRVLGEDIVLYANLTAVPLRLKTPARTANYLFRWAASKATTLNAVTTV